MRFTVPQFIDVEDQILGPLSVRQFVTILGTLVTLAILWKLLDFAAFLVAGIPIFALGAVVFPFLKVNGQPFHFFLLNVVQTFSRPKLRVWDKALMDFELLKYAKQEPPPPPERKVRKEPLTASRLTELSLVVNTGGTYNPEE